MPNRKRKHQVILRLDDCEYKKFKDNLNKTGMKQREYIFNLVTQQPIFHIHALDEVEEQIRKIGVNINQIAKRANCNDEVLQDDLKLIMKEQIKIWQLLKQLKVVPQSNE